MNCPKGEIDQQELLDHANGCQQERWQREFDAGISRLIATVARVMQKTNFPPPPANPDKSEACDLPRTQQLLLALVLILFAWALETTLTLIQRWP